MASVPVATSPVTAIPTAPIQPLQNPLAPYLHNQTQVLSIVFCLLLVVWLVYTAVIFYHWVKYGHRSPTMVPALVVHLFVSTGLFLMAASGFA